MSPAEYALHGTTAVITLANPPVNGLGHALRSGIVTAIDRANADSAVFAIVITGSERAFSGGADVREFGTPKASQEPHLPNVIRVVEASAKPVVAAIAGVCLGGGLELAMGCHFRVARPDASLGLPEIKLGLLPGATGTQRLPRLVGLERALNLIVSGEPQRAATFEGTRLIDALIDGDLLQRALAFAGTVLAEGRPIRRVRDMKVDAAGADAFLQFARNSVAAATQGLPAPLKCLDALAAAVDKPFDEGCRLERSLFMQLMATPESRALRHVFAAERAAAKVADLPADTPVRAIRKVGIVGAGTMGGGITMAFANAGLPVVLLETRQEALDKGLATIRGNYESSLKKGRLTPEAMAERLALISPTLSYDAFADVDLVIEAVFEDLGVKEQVFKLLDAAARPGAILASNTSALNLNRIAAFTARPHDVVGLHFFSPAHVMKLLEVVRGDKTAPDVLATAMGLARKIGKVAVVSGVCEGFIGNRMLARYLAAADELLNIGALPQQIDRALENFGMAMGIFRVADLAGLDIGWAGRKRLAAARPGEDLSVVADRLCEAGRFGQKTGAGWYRYAPGRRDAMPDAAVEQVIEQWRRDKGYTPRRVSDEEIVERCIYALVNEGARIVEQGIAQRASDIDVVYFNGYGFPRHRGGPMCHADTVGLFNVVRALRRIAAESPADAAMWAPAPLLLRLAEEGKTFN